MDDGTRQHLLSSEQIQVLDPTKHFKFQADMHQKVSKTLFFSLKIVQNFQGLQSVEKRAIGGSTLWMHSGTNLNLGVTLCLD